MSTFVLVHGAWTGSFGFRHVRRALQAHGHEVFTPSLTGLGERVHLASPQVTLTTHVQDVVNCVLYEDLHEICLLGFSYGGAVVTGALEHLADRVRHLVYLDAFVPSDGQSVSDVLGAPAPSWGLGAPAFVLAAPREFDDPAEAEFINARRLPHPVACFGEPVRLPQPLESYPFTRTYIKATASSPDVSGEPVFSATAQRLRESTAWRHHEIASNHMVASNRPHDLVAVLEGLVDEPSDG